MMTSSQLTLNVMTRVAVALVPIMLLHRLVLLESVGRITRRY
ncbi:hypothetical protein ACNKHV_03405 [Shigella flexneri]